MSKRLRIDKNDLWKVFKVALWSGGSALIITLADLLSSAEYADEYGWLVALLNTLGVLIKKLVSSK